MFLNIMSESEEVTSSFHPDKNLLATPSRSFIEARLRIDENVLYDNQCQYSCQSDEHLITREAADVK